ncbi:hypothetical protein HATV-3_gp87 [Haloarcula tailed virus 3]|jgi:hypothetical protein|uniref:Uncharacterized protein n=1 Tax=Haloarcula tailed virus 3 TaxID=2877990 RepID=A0AAE8Y082_9CAUD|nr:hypothetical protein M1M35_gp87 [Haloarcula tailed virus 3]UBF23437.1 hypothetical protein HATV-3_gp87 [Haloarcula tailed virus 3]
MVLQSDVTVDIDTETINNAVREKFTEASGPPDTTQVKAPISPFDECFQSVNDVLKDTDAIPDDALIQRIVVDAPGEYVRVWYDTE